VLFGSLLEALGPRATAHYSGATRGCLPLPVEPRQKLPANQRVAGHARAAGIRGRAATAGSLGGTRALSTPPIGGTADKPNLT